MKKILFVFGLVFCLGCASRTIPLRNQIHTGMTITDVWQLYGYDTNDPNTYNNVVKYVLVDEHTADECIVNTYRFPLCNGDPKSIWARKRRIYPYLLTFRMCKMPNYDDVVPCMTDNVLVRITLDDAYIRHSQGQENLSFINQTKQKQDWQHWELKNQLQQIENQASFDRLQMRKGGLP